MKKTPWKATLFWIAFTEAVGFAAGFLTRQGAQIYNDAVAKPTLSPPPVVFPIVWGILYALMGVSAARVYLKSENPWKSAGIRLYLAQLLFNFCWCFLFFNFRAFALAFVWLLALLALVLFMNAAFRKTARLAAALQIPYILWLIFAAYLNLSVWMLNR